MKPLILASSSPYRKALLQKLGIPFTCVSPDVDEEKIKNEMLGKGKSAQDIAEALSLAKAEAAREKSTADSLILSGDQVVSLDGRLLGKPGNYDGAVNQLRLLNGREHKLITAITLLGDKTPVCYTHVTLMKMKTLTAQEITNYVKADHAFDCAGSYKIEENGIALFESVQGDDFTAIQGVPLIWLSNRLKEMGYELFKF